MITMGFIKEYKKAQLENAGYEVVPVIKIAEIEGKPFTVKDVKIQYDAKGHNGKLVDRAILTVIVDNEKRILFINQKWLFEMFEQGRADADYGTLVLRKKVKGDKTFWDIDKEDDGRSEKDCMWEGY